MKKSHILTVVGIVALLGLVYYVVSPVEQATASVTLKPNEPAVVALGEQVYAQNCASCHGVALEGQANWRREMQMVISLRHHMTKQGTLGTTPTRTLLMTKYGIEEMIGKPYPNNMPAYEDKLTDEEILAVPSYIKAPGLAAHSVSTTK